ncbi:MAG: 50S ribosomal protein L9 [Armatimonadota bacterium]
MRVILNEDVDRLGIAGEVVEVSDGYARNFLLPRRLAMEATKGALTDLERRRTSLEKREQARREAALAELERLKEVSVTIVHKAGAEGKLHGSVTAQAIADALKEQTGYEVEKSQIDLVQPIRTVGKFLVTVKLFRDVVHEMPVAVESETGMTEVPSEEAAGEAEEGPSEEPVQEPPPDEDEEAGETPKQEEPQGQEE